MQGVRHCTRFIRHNVFMVVRDIPSSSVLSHGVMWQTGTNIFAECTASIFTLCSSSIFVPPYQTTVCCPNTDFISIPSNSPLACSQQVESHHKMQTAYGNVCVQNLYKRLCSSCKRLAIISRSAITHYLSHSAMYTNIRQQTCKPLLSGNRR